jgi:hypothetical protein
MRQGRPVVVRNVLKGVNPESFSPQTFVRAVALVEKTTGADQDIEIVDCLDGNIVSKAMLSLVSGIQVIERIYLQ